MNSNDINAQLIDLWNKYPSERGELVPLFYGNLKKNSILFIGLNPSFSITGIKSLLKNTKYSGLDLNTYFNWKEFNNSKLATFIEIEEIARGYAYYKRCHDIAKDNNTEFEHIDLFFIRDTSQKNIEAALKSKEKQMKDLFQKQLSLAHGLIKEVDPKVIVVINAKGCSILKEYLRERLSPFDEKLGYNYIKINNKNIPIFFSGMLSGVHPLDNGSYERLKWHIKQAINTK